MAKKLEKYEINAFSIAGKLLENPKKGFSKDKVFCELNLIIPKVNSIKVRVYGIVAEDLPLKFYKGDKLLVKGEFIETVNGIERIVTKITPLKVAGDLTETKDKVKDCFSLYNPKQIDKRKFENETRNK